MIALRTIGFAGDGNDALFFQTSDVIIDHRAAQIGAFCYFMLTGTRFVADRHEDGESSRTFGGIQIVRMNCFKHLSHSPLLMVTVHSLTGWFAIFVPINNQTNVLNNSNFCQQPTR